MSMRSWQLLVLLAATFTTGLMAGVFGDWAVTIMRGLRETDDRTFIGAFQALDRAIYHPLFMLTFMGALGLTGVATLLYLRGDDREPLLWVAAAFVLYLVAFVITIAVNVPLNNGLSAAGDPDRITDLAAVRAAFHETSWVAWNIVRTITTTVAFACLIWALVLHGQTAGPVDATSGPSAAAGGHR
jgi:uncharacterized membrane protein